MSPDAHGLVELNGIVNNTVAMVDDLDGLSIFASRSGLEDYNNCC